MDYQFNEGSITVPDDLEDRTMHILSPRPGAIAFTLIVSHDELEADENTEQFLKRQLVTLARQVIKYEEEPWTAIRLGDPKHGVQGTHIALRYKQQGKFVYHHQAAFPIPNDKHLLTFTASLPMPFSAVQLQQFAEVLKSYKARS
jgi:hypothetical protein